MTPAVSAHGQHLLIDLYDASNLTDIDHIRDALKQAAEMCGATVLDINLHSFGENQGVTGVAMLAESHISIHTWPECQFAAIDIFMCGRCQPQLAVDYLKNAFLTESANVTCHSRGARLPQK